MVIEVYLATGLYNNKNYTLADNENLTIKLVGNTYANATYYLKAKNGSNLFQIKFIDNLVSIDRKNLTYGKLSAKIIGMVNENIIREVNIEDLYLKEIDNKYKVIPEVKLVKEQFENVKRENEDLKKKVIELEDLCKKTTELVLKLNQISEKVGE